MSGDQTVPTGHAREGSVSATAIAEYVSAHPGRTIAQIANAVGRDPVAVSAALNEALRAGLVEVNRSRWERPRSRA